MDDIEKYINENWDGGKIVLKSKVGEVTIEVFVEEDGVRTSLSGKTNLADLLIAQVVLKEVANSIEEGLEDEAEGS